MSTKFSTILSSTGTAVLKRRANIINDNARQAQLDLINTLKKKLRVVDSRIADLEDLSVKSTDSLVVGESFDADVWVEKMQQNRLDKRDLQIELEIAESVMAEYFTESGKGDRSE